MNVHPLMNALRHERERQQLTQQQIANRTGWNVRTIRSAETGLNSPMLQMVEDYAHALGIAVALVGRRGGQVIEVPDRLASRQLCPGCGNDFQVTRRNVIRKHRCTAKEEK